jgi:sulfur-oxidizing protein SoxY
MAERLEAGYFSNRVRYFEKPDMLAKHQTKLSRRAFLRSIRALTALVAAGLPLFGRAATKKPATSGADHTLQRALAEALDGKSWTATDRIAFEVPDLAENGAIVPISVESRLPNTGQILIFVEKNPNPLSARFHFEAGADGFVSLRIKMNETSDVLAIAESEGRYFGVRKTVRVMLGGCG